LEEKKILILNAYCGLGGNRKLWPSDEIEVTAVEKNKEIAKIYQDFFPKDKVIVADAHQYLLEHYKEFDFIWSSPPCKTHSGMNNFLNPQGKVRYPDMSLYQEILYLKHFAKCLWVVENVKSMWYVPLIKPQICGRHYFWSNFHITNITYYKADIGTFNRAASIFAQKMNTKNQFERNRVKPEIGLHIFNCAFRIKQKVISEY